MEVQSLLTRFWSKVSIKAHDECWLFSGCKDQDGYGKFKSSGKMYAAHRVAFIIFHGIDKLDSVKDCVLHTCDNPPCVNPSHLWSGDQASNIKDRNLKGRTRNGWTGLCKNGHDMNVIGRRYTSSGKARGCLKCYKEKL